jgi:hypothetical protein
MRSLSRSLSVTVATAVYSNMRMYKHSRSFVSACTYRSSCSCITAKHASFLCARVHTQADVPLTRARVMLSHARIQGKMDFNSMPTWTDSLVQYLKEVLLPFVHPRSVRSDM